MLELTVPAIVVSAYGNLQPQKVIPKGNSVSVDLNEKIALIPMWWDFPFMLSPCLPERQEWISMAIMVRDLPFDERPREKLIASGAACLSNVELLAILLRTGTKEQSVIRVAEQVLEHLQLLQNMLKK